MPTQEEMPECPHCGQVMTVEYDRFYGGIPRYRAQCSYCGMCGPICGASVSAISAVKDLYRKSGMPALASPAKRCGICGRYNCDTDHNDPWPPFVS